MRIDSIPPKELLNRYVHVREMDFEESPVASTDEAELTSEAKTFSAALKAARETVETQTPERARRMEEIAKQLADGTYYVPGEKVAEKILEKWPDLIERG